LSKRPSLLLAIAAATGVACSSSRAKDAGTADAGAQDARTFFDAGARDLPPLEVAPRDLGILRVDARDVAPPEVETSDLGSSGDTSDDAICSEGCQQGNDVCGASYDMCVALCRQDFGTGACLSQKRAAQLCVIAAGKDAITCMNGLTFVKPGYCESEKSALTACLHGLPVDAGGG